MTQQGRPSSEEERRLRRIQSELEAERGGQRVDMSDVTTRVKRVVMRNPRLARLALGSMRRLQRYEARSQEAAFRRQRRKLPAGLASPVASPLTGEYRALIEEMQVVDPRSARNLAFCVSSRDPDSGRGDLYVAAGLARALRKLGWRTSMFGPSSWDLIPDGMDVVVAMVPSVEPQRLPPGAVRVAWARSFLDQWLAGDQVSDWDAWLAVSDVMAGQLRDRVSAPVGVLPIGVDPELFVLPPAGGRRAGVVSTTNDFGSGRQLLRFLEQAGPPKSLVLYGNRRRRSRRTRRLRRCEAGPISYFSIPSVYGTAAVVLDDQLPGARSVGSLNSRIYESLAAGALPITNSALALEGVGLAGVPVYRDPAELAHLINEHEGFGPEAAALVGRLREIVLDRHTFDHRARSFTEFVSSLTESGSAPRRPKITLGFFPDYREENHYQSMLFEGARAAGVSIAAMENPIWDSPDDMAGTTRIWNIHWTVPFFAGIDDEEQARRRVANLVDRLELFRANGGIVVWTVHNREPHENRFPVAERELQDALARLADHVHVMCRQTASELPALAEVEPERLLVIPHSSYVGWYPDVISQQAARRRLGLDQGAPVVGLIGGVRPYKGIDRLLQALDRPEVAAAGLRALVAGKPSVHPDAVALCKRIKAHPRVTSHLAFIDHVELQVFMKAADVIVLPYRQTLNSGALLAALSFGRPVIAPRSGCLTEALDDQYSIGFDIEEDESWVDALTRVESLRTPTARRAARRAAGVNLSRDMSRRFFEAVLPGPGGQAP